MSQSWLIQTLSLPAQIGPALAKDLNEQDVDCFLKLYDNIRLKSNIPTEIIDHIDKNLIQVKMILSLALRISKLFVDLDI